MRGYIYRSSELYEIVKSRGIGAFKVQTLPAKLDKPLLITTAYTPSNAFPPCATGNALYRKFETNISRN